MEKKHHLIRPINSFNGKTYFKIMDMILSMVKNDVLQYGEKLYKEDELIEMLNVSRASLREALRVMEFLGFVTVRPRTGIIINYPEETNDYFPLKYILYFEKIGSSELIEVRKAMEIESAGLAAKRGTEEDFAELKKPIDEYKREEDIEKLIILDSRVHEIIMEASKNHLMQKLYMTFLYLINEQQQGIGHNIYKNIDHLKYIKDLHYNLCYAIIERDERSARTLMEEQMEFVYESVSLLLE